MYSSVNKNDAQTNDALGNKLNSASRKVLNFFDHTGQEFSHAKETVSTHIKESPLRSTLIALSVGFAIGALFRR